MRISDWSSDVCSSDLPDARQGGRGVLRFPLHCTGRSLRFLAGSRLLRGPLEDRQEIILQSKTALEPCRTSQNFGSSAASARSRSESEERSVGKECVSTCRSRCPPYH